MKCSYCGSYRVYTKRPLQKTGPQSTMCRCCGVSDTAVQDSFVHRRNTCPNCQDRKVSRFESPCKECTNNSNFTERKDDK